MFDFIVWFWFVICSGISSQTHKDKGVPRDVWEMTLEFVATTKADLSNFDENGAFSWPFMTHNLRLIKTDASFDFFAQVLGQLLWMNLLHGIARSCNRITNQLIWNPNALCSVICTD